RKWGNLELQEYSDTASAAKDLHEGKISPDTGVIACKKCSKLYELNLLEEEIQNLKFNFTTFIAVTI
ncbi:MAG: chorismate mutase, partial [Candidatus Pacebacteria bacterium]|nr:chorismate mutase [Candidatus Paceibacterota bacterium]